MEKNKKIILIGALTIVSLLMSSCISFSGFDPGSSNPVSENYEVIGNVSKQFQSHQLFFIIAIPWGDNKLDAIERLREKAADDLGADDVINISVENKIFSMLGIYFKKTFVLKGLAIKYN